MISARLVHPEFHEGDEVVLAEGTYQGTLGVFLHLREDVNWADAAIETHFIIWVYTTTSSVERVAKRKGAGNLT